MIYNKKLIIHLFLLFLINIQIRSEDIIFLEKENYFKASQLANSLKIIISEKDSLNCSALLNESFLEV
jgi:hypothetical protein